MLVLEAGVLLALLGATADLQTLLRAQGLLPGAGEEERAGTACPRSLLMLLAAGLAWRAEGARLLVEFSPCPCQALFEP